MKLTESMLKSIIREELTKVLEAHDDWNAGGHVEDGRTETPLDAAAKNKKQYQEMRKQYAQEVKAGKTKLAWDKWYKKAKFKAFSDRNQLPTEFPEDDREAAYGQDALRYHTS
jgi:hypothetical protein